MELVAPAITAAVCYPASLLPGAFVVYLCYLFLLCQLPQLLCSSLTISLPECISKGVGQRTVRASLVMTAWTVTTSSCKILVESIQSQDFLLFNHS